MTAPVPADQEEALREELRHAHARYLSARDVEATTYSCVRAAVEPIVEEIATLRAERDQLASELREAREEGDVFEVKLDGSEARVRILYDHLDWWRTKGKAAEANLITLAEMYGEACSELQVLRALAQDVADEAEGLEPHDYEVIGTTYDGVKVLRQISEPTNFTREEIRAAVEAALQPRSTKIEGAGEL